MSNYIHR